MKIKIDDLEIELLSFRVFISSTSAIDSSAKASEVIHKLTAKYPDVQYTGKDITITNTMPYAPEPLFKVELEFIDKQIAIKADY